MLKSMEMGVRYNLGFYSHSLSTLTSLCIMLKHQNNYIYHHLPLFHLDDNNKP